MRTITDIATAFLALSGFALAGCTTDAPAPIDDGDAQALIGTWSAADTTRFVFGDGGDALWIFGQAADEDTFRIQYDYDAEFEPAHLDLTGFDRGFLEGRTLYCIVAFDSTSVFRMDCEPGQPAESIVRPDSFTQRTMIYRTTSTD